MNALSARVTEGVCGVLKSMPRHAAQVESPQGIAAAQTGKKSLSDLLGTPAGATRALSADLHRRDRCPHASPVSADGGQHYFT